MVLILSTEMDYSTKMVMEWLLSWGIKVLRINPSDTIVIEKIGIQKNEEDVVFTVKNKQFSFSEITAYWYRRGHFSIDKAEVPEVRLSSEVQKHLNDEISSIDQYLHYLLRKKKSINSFFDNSLNKLAVLSEAKKCGLIIPDTIISGLRRQLEIACNNKDGIITKAISNGIVIHKDNEVIQSYTSRVSSMDLASYDAKIFPSLIQEQIEKVFELRIFFLDGVFYPMAIFSQNNKQTEVDFRKYDFEKPNRTVPYVLVDPIIQKLSALISLLQLKSGSIDMIVTTAGEHVFLEINPIGQYGMTSYPCNYYLDLKIAEYLS